MMTNLPIGKFVIIGINNVTSISALLHVRPVGVEPTTICLRGNCGIYPALTRRKIRILHVFVRPVGVEPTTICLRGNCSTN